MIHPIQTRVLKESIPYTGTELRPHWALEKTGLYGSAVVAFVGPCDVPTGNLVDWEDRLNADFIRAESMLHVIAEFFGTTLEAGVLYQRLLACHFESRLRALGVKIRRSGDDLFDDQERKLSVSIATVSSVSVLIHFGVNVNSAGAPVSAAGLGELLDWNSAQVLTFAKDVLAGYIGELEEIRLAQCKVRPVES